MIIFQIFYNYYVTVCRIIVLGRQPAQEKHDPDIPEPVLVPGPGVSDGPADRVVPHGAGHNDEEGERGRDRAARGGGTEESRQSAQPEGGQLAVGPGDLHLRSGTK